MNNAFDHLRRFPLITATVAAAAMGLHASPGIQNLCQLDHASTGVGQAYRLFTCHLIHWSDSHFAWDVAPFILLGVICERQSRLGFSGCLIAAAFTVSLSIKALESGPWLYRGLSGIDSALILFASVAILRRSDRVDWHIRWIAAATIIAFLSKSGFELLTKRAVFVDSLGAGFVPDPLAHVIGAATGGALALAWPLLQAAKSRND